MEATADVERCSRTTDVSCLGKEKGALPVLNLEPGHRIKRRLLEVFSIHFPDFTEAKYMCVCGIILLKTPTVPYTLAKRRIGHPQIIDHDGFVRLTGPERGIEANDVVSLVPILFHVGFAAFDMSPRHDIWRADMEGKDSLYDQLMVHRWENIFGAMELNYAIYEDGAEAHMDVTVINWEGEKVEVYGTVGVRNNKITDLKARSLLFNSNNEEAIGVVPGKVTHLPLIRQVTVLPLDSVLIVDVCLLHRGTIFAQGTVRFIARSIGDEELILVCHVGMIKVRATWLNHCQIHKEAGEN